MNFKQLITTCEKDVAEIMWQMRERLALKLSEVYAEHDLAAKRKLAVKAWYGIRRR